MALKNLKKQIRQVMEVDTKVEKQYCDLALEKMKDIINMLRDFTEYRSGESYSRGRKDALNDIIRLLEEMEENTDVQEE